MTLKDKIHSDVRIIRGGEYFLEEDVKEAILKDKAYLHILVGKLVAESLFTKEIEQYLEEYYQKRKEIFGDFKKV